MRKLSSKPISRIRLLPRSRIKQSKDHGAAEGLPKKCYAADSQSFAPRIRASPVSETEKLILISTMVVFTQIVMPDSPGHSSFQAIVLLVCDLAFFGVTISFQSTSREYGAFGSPLSGCRIDLTSMLFYTSRMRLVRPCCCRSFRACPVELSAVAQTQSFS